MTVSVDEALVRRLAELSNIELSPDEIGAFVGDLGKILAYVRVLEEADVAGVAPLASALQAQSGPEVAHDERQRQDDERPSLARDVALASAPRADRDEGTFVVPAFVDEG